MRMLRVMAISMVAWWSLACTGCGRPEGMHAVSGRVLYKGQPAAGATLFFHQNGGEAPRHDVVPMGITQSDGTFRLTCDGVDGAPTGKYNVTVVWRDRSASTSAAPQVIPASFERGKRKAIRTVSRIKPSTSLPADRLQGRYSDNEHPRLKAEVKAEFNDLGAFDLVD